MTAERASHRRWALSLTVPEPFLEELARAAVGDGIEVAAFRNVFQLPMKGPLELSVSMTITGVSFAMRAEHPDALLATVRANGRVEVLGDSPMPVLPGVARVRGDVLVRPVVELRDDGGFVAVLDLPAGELVSMELEGIDGLEADADAQRQLSQMLFAAVGGELFEGLAANLGQVGIDLPAVDAAILGRMGVRPGPADLTVHDGRLVLGLPATDSVVGEAEEVAVRDSAVGVGLSATALEVLTVAAAASQIPGVLPVEVDLETSARRVGARVRSTRLVGSPLLPDLRSSLRTTLRPRLVGGHIEVSLREAWVELPSPVPDVVNRFNRFMGGALSRAQLAVKLPSRVTLPVGTEADRHVTLAVTSLDVDAAGVSAVVEAHF
jgi:hypothetical protein